MPSATTDIDERPLDELQLAELAQLLRLDLDRIRHSSRAELERLACLALQNWIRLASTEAERRHYRSVMGHR